MQFLSNVNSFPTTKMGSVNKLLTENSLTRLINRLVDVDGFIITDCIYEKENPIIGNGGKHPSINEDIGIDTVNYRNNLFEFIIRGYYFSVPLSELRSLITPISPYSETMGLYARIFIDNTIPDYPELIGQTAYEESEDPSEEHGPWQGVEFFVCPLTSKQPPEHPYFDNDPTILENGLGTDYFYYDLMLLKYVIDDPTEPNGIYIPFESLCKFDTHSQAVIDGGELKFNVSE